MKNMGSKAFRITGSFATAKRAAEKAYKFCEAQILPHTLEGSNISYAEFWVLYAAADLRNLPKSIELANLLGFDKALISRSISNLVKDGYVTKVFKENNQRSFGIKPTKSGLSYVNRFETLSDTLFHSFEQNARAYYTFHEDREFRQILTKFDLFTDELSKFDYSESQLSYIKSLIKIS